MPVPQQRDLEVARGALSRWLADRLGARDVTLSDITGPAFTGFSNETLLFDAEWIAEGERHRQGMVARVKPTAYTIFLESVFSLPGLGQTALNSLSSFDLPVTMGVVIFGTLAIIVFNLVVDLLYAVIDPRIRLG